MAFNPEPHEFSLQLDLNAQPMRAYGVKAKRDIRRVSSTVYESIGGIGIDLGIIAAAQVAKSLDAQASDGGIACSELLDNDTEYGAIRTHLQAIVSQFMIHKQNENEFRLTYQLNPSYMNDAFVRTPLLSRHALLELLPRVWYSRGIHMDEANTIVIRDLTVVWRMAEMYGGCVDCKVNHRFGKTKTQEIDAVSNYVTRYGNVNRELQKQDTDWIMLPTYVEISGINARCLRCKELVHGGTSRDEATSATQ